LIADGTVLAHYGDNRWQVEGSAFREKGRRALQGVGPYSAFRLMDGIAYESERVFASFDRQHEDWYSHSLGIHWPMMAVLATTAAPDLE
jgi:hypothetical protein